MRAAWSLLERYPQGHASLLMALWAQQHLNPAELQEIVVASS